MSDWHSSRVAFESGERKKTLYTYINPVQVLYKEGVFKTNVAGWHFHLQL